MFYIHHTSFISPQQTFGAVDFENLRDVVNNKLQVIEPSYEGIPAGILRRMGKAIRIGVGTALPIIKNNNKTIDGIIIGTANGGMEDCIKFLNQIIDYNEGMLTPTNFVQSTTNAIAAQIGLLSNNKSYNITHVHRGLSFENALLDAGMLLKENVNAGYLVGGVDEISTYNYNIDWLDGWFKTESIPAHDLYTSGTVGSIAGEGSAMFLTNNEKEDAIASITGLHLLHSADKSTVADQLKLFLEKHLPSGESVDLFLSGEDGDNRMLPFYEACEKVLNNQTSIARFKHMTGEYPTASAAATWFACNILQQQVVPQHMLKYDLSSSAYNRILIYNTYKGQQHSFILVKKA